MESDTRVLGRKQSKTMEEEWRWNCVKAVDREKWITISKIAVPLKVLTAMAAEVAGNSMFTGVPDLLLDKKFNMEKHQRTHQ